MNNLTQTYANAVKLAEANLRAAQAIEGRCRFAEAAIIETLKELGLEVSGEFVWSKTGSRHNWVEGDKASLTIRATPTSGKFKFPKRESTAAKKAESLAMKFSQSTGYIHAVEVNEYSLMNGSVSVSVWVAQDPAFQG